MVFIKPHPLIPLLQRGRPNYKKIFDYSTDTSGMNIVSSVLGVNGPAEAESERSYNAKM